MHYIGVRKRFAHRLLTTVWVVARLHSNLNPHNLPKLNFKLNYGFKNTKPKCEQ